MRLQSYLNRNNYINECIILAKKFGDDIVLGKNRDRNYTPEIKIVREMLGELEVCLFIDQETDWTEGMNSLGIGVVNTALMVKDDEKEHEKAKSGKKKSKDGIKVREALSKSNIDDVVKVLISRNGGIMGHTIVSDGNKLVIIENTSEIKPTVKEYDINKDPIVRTNHGVFNKDIGYTEGEDAESSRTRYKNALDILKKEKDYRKVLPQFYNHKQDKGSKFDLVRTQNKLYTSSQMLMNLKKKEITLYLIPGAIKFLGMDNKLPKGYKSKIDLNIRMYEKSPNDKYGVFVTSSEIEDAPIKDIQIKI